MTNEVNDYMSTMPSGDLDVLLLMNHIREQASKKRDQHLRFLNWEKIVEQKKIVDLASIEALIDEAERCSQVRTKFPQTLERLPFSRSKILRKFFFKAYELLFREQRLVHQTLIEALRKVVSLNHVLNEKVNSIDLDQANGSNAFEKLKARVDTLAIRTGEINAHDDDFYAEFEDRFRGNREEIKERLKVYLPIIEKAKIGSAISTLLDIGCGRGEWLELLRERGLCAKGIELNRVLVDRCRARGLDVLEGDAIDYLQSMPDASVGAVTGFHIIEHIPFGMLLRLFDEALRVLVPGGIIIFETPNPGNILSGSVNFYTDPTHIRPLPSDLMRFTATARGYMGVEILPLQLYPNHIHLTGSDVAERFNQYFYGAQDYAVIGYKP